MTVEITQVNSCRKNLAAEISVEELEKEFEKIAREYSRTVKIPGFRPGKIPTSIIRRRFEKEIYDDTSRRIIDRVWNEAVGANDFKPLNQPEVKAFENKPGSPLKFTLTFEELPQLEVKDYKGIEIKQDSAKVNDEEVAQAMERVREQYAQFVPVEGEAGDGHYLLIDIESLTEGESTPLREEDVTFIIGHLQSIAEFSENLKGAKVDDVRSFEVGYPEDYQSKNIAGVQGSDKGD